MKAKLAITYGILTWFFIYILSTFLSQVHIDDGIPHINIFIPLSIIIVTIFFGILYIRNFNKNEVKEGFLLGIMLFVVDLILDNILMIIVGPTKLIIDTSPMHILTMLILFPLITTLLGYLAQMKIELI
ncbi:hypothetical protein LJC03_05720 [Methanobrevibacter sp. OttesenSCG-928-I08]|nr:hypothetical protein [Methanobrevibacter sp. OttesenSCG-928-I08]